MDENIKSIVLVFENVDSVEISVRDVAVLEMDGLKRIVKQYYGTNIRSFMACLGHFVIGIKADGNKEYYPFGFTDLPSKKVFDRLMEHKDIVSVILKYKDDSAAEYFLDWGGNIDEVNNYQMSYTDKDGMLYVVVDREMVVEHSR